jgi:hypothetical protein
VAGVHSRTKSVSKRARQRPDGNKVGQREAVRELPDRERRSIDRTWREHRGHARAVLQAGVEHRLVLGDLIAAGTSDVLDRYGEIPDLERSIGHCLDAPAPLDAS